MNKKIRPTPITDRVNTTKLIELVAADLGKKPSEVHDVVMATFNVIVRALVARQSVALTNFGTFRTDRAKRREARNPQTGGMVTVPAHWAPRFRYSPPLVEAVRNRDRKATIKKASSRPKAVESSPSDG